jgi:hypothetical protein
VSRLPVCGGGGDPNTPRLSTIARAGGVARILAPCSGVYRGWSTCVGGSRVCTLVWRLVDERMLVKVGGSRTGHFAGCDGRLLWARVREVRGSESEMRCI